MLRKLQVVVPAMKTVRCWCLGGCDGSCFWYQGYPVFVTLLLLLLLPLSLTSLCCLSSSCCTHFCVMMRRAWLRWPITQDHTAAGVKWGCVPVSCGLTLGEEEFVVYSEWLVLYCEGRRCCCCRHTGRHFYFRLGWGGEADSEAGGGRETAAPPQPHTRCTPTNPHQHHQPPAPVSTHCILTVTSTVNKESGSIGYPYAPQGRTKASTMVMLY